ncbi:MULTISPECIES: hypothetical protein [Paraburkholderia]|uniref:Uncharacterized protein n=1 Tax=Paraburkholderia madseniana TaxID=2599607 RepID=A0AAP5BMR7_9BURK|nr:MULTISPECIES: hypothetical protein [Paraburkholderia]MCX4151033.1 hypothetical protein [Paraburkholderia madseniana]MCX4176673.1 hypothetical protein [Paraburkholderia madseniana]MDN7153965.1 hypothetical protein [Paraburkholderia sp. WS6]MDQ6412847.1 hypothetical protein [Paraburkholderia madseniana]MDQ6464664.1 hypothetical protein [Paraburkholderia madseniana]
MHQDTHTLNAPIMVPAPTPEPVRSTRTTMVMVAAMTAMLMSIGALNGGSALGSSAWDVFVTTIQTVMSSTFIMFLIMLGLLITVWQLAHGSGYRNLTVVLGVLVVGLIGPSIATTVATATGPGDAVSVQMDLGTAQ